LRAGGMEYADGVLLLMGSNGNRTLRRKEEGEPLTNTNQGSGCNWGGRANRAPA
jgi:hypothetical protein